MGNPLPVIKDERIAFDGGTLRIWFRSEAPFFAVELHREGSVEKVAPILRQHGDFFAAIDLSGVPDWDDYAIQLRSSDEPPVRFGQSLAEARQLLRTTHGDQGTASKIVENEFGVDGAIRHVWALVDFDSLVVNLRLSDRDDVEAFATRQPTPATAQSARYSVIACAYNVARYLDDFFKSITEQSLKFRDNIELIVIDDGSTDGSAKLIKRWQRKYPQNIFYHRKGNGGLSSARNFGLQFASNPWITFIDPDDFIDKDYFSSIHSHTKFLHNSRIATIFCNMQNYYEDKNKIVDDHSLNWRFKSGTKKIHAELDRFIHFNANCAFFSKGIIERFGLKFEEIIRPNFEDTHFIQRYLLRSPSKIAVFVPEAKYYYRRRSDQSSLSQTAYTHPEWYGDQLEHGYLALLKEAKRLCGNVPRYVQNIVFCDLQRQLRWVLNNSAAVPFLEQKRIDRFSQLLVDIFAFIDPDTIDNYDASVVSQLFRVGIHHTFKNTAPAIPVLVVEHLDSAKSLAKFVYWSQSPEETPSFRVDGVDLNPTFRKLRRHDFLGLDFAWEIIDWLPVGSGRLVEAFVGSRKARIDVKTTRHPRGVLLSDIRRAFTQNRFDETHLRDSVRTIRSVARSPQVVATLRDSWLFMDQDSYADDNAEHLFRFVRQARPDINAFFVLRQGSSDWARLSEEGFRLIPFGGPDHFLALLNARHLIASHADYHVWRYLAPESFGDMCRYKFTCLQHGVTKDDMSGWFNQMPIDCLVTATPAEFHSIIDDRSPYRFGLKEAVLTGFPRHDALLRSGSKNSDAIIVMPTWRQSLTSDRPSEATKGGVNPAIKRATNPLFFESEFACRWKAVLHSDELATIAKGAGVQLVFVVHARLEPYIDFFEVPPHVVLKRIGEGGSIQELFRRASLMVTDYSSAAFDMAYIEKPVVYYQFDRDFVFSGGHTYRRGYFDYERDGFGPVVGNEGQLLAAIRESLEAGPVARSVYRQRAASTFAFRDGKCCERVLEAILALDRPLDEEIRSGPQGEVRGTEPLENE